MEVTKEVFVKAEDDMSLSTEGLAFVETTGKSLLFVGASRTGTLTAHNVEALRQLTGEVGKENKNGRVVFAPQPDVALSRYVGNMIRGLQREEQNSITNGFLSNIDPRARYWNRFGSDLLTKRAQDVSISGSEWLQFWNGLLEANSTSNESLSDLQKRLNLVYENQTLTELPLSEHFALWDVTLVRHWVDTNGTGENVAVDYLSPSQTRTEIGQFKGEDYSLVPDVHSLFDEFHQDRALDRKTEVMGKALSFILSDLATGYDTQKEYFDEFLKNLTLVNRSRDRIKFLREAEVELPCQMPPCESDEQFRSEVVSTLIEALTYHFPAALEGLQVDTNGKVTGLRVNDQIFWEQVFSNWDFMTKEVAASLFIRYSQPEAVLNHLRSLNKERVTGPELFAYLLERSAQGTGEVVLRQNFAGNPRGDAFPKAASIRNNWANGDHNRRLSQVYAKLPLNEDDWMPGSKDKSFLTLFR